MVPQDLLTAPLSAVSIQEKLAALRSLMTQHQLDGYLVPSADEHLNEYLPEEKQRRVWVSGFTGSAGDLLVGREWCWLFVDSRYHEQVDLEVESALFQVSKLGLEGQKTLLEQLESLGQEAMTSGTPFRLGFDPFTVSVEDFRDLQKRLEPVGVSLVLVSGNLVDQVRHGFSIHPPASDVSPVFALPDEVTGESRSKKLERLREELKKARATLLPITKLDQIAWLFNLRSWDIAYNPVLIAYAIVTLDKAFLFTNLDRISLELQESLQGDVTLLPYAQYGETLKALVADQDAPKVLLDFRRTTLGTYALLVADPLDPPRKGIVVEAANPIEVMKARKNSVEVAQMHQANLKASRAKTRTLRWLQTQVAAGNAFSEQDVARTVERFYAEEMGFQGLSFNTIAGAGANSSIVHYGTPNPQVMVQPGQLLLLDSGAQYLAGTTDDTRTTVIGEPTAEQIDRYTQVLKAHINCAMQTFPKGTTGVQLDGITRACMWHAQLDYGHGTGHGVGAFLNVHEGPNGISRRAQAALEPGMVTSIEPGFYQPGWGGIRIENLYGVVELPVPGGSTPDPNAAPWYGFESLTYIPFEKRLIDLSQLDARQRQWLEGYYAQVVEKLAPTLSPEDADWLREECRL